MGKKRPDKRGVFWEDTWVELEKQLETTSLINFRSNENIIRRLSTYRQSDRGNWHIHCVESKIPPKMYQDSLIGDPPDNHIAHQAKLPYTGDSCRHAKIAHYIQSYFNPDHPIKVLEVGAGYGSFPEHMFRRFDIQEYHIIDAPVLNRLQTYYLTEAKLYEKCYIHPIADEYALPEIDLIVSIHTLSEMRPEIVQQYLDLFKHVLKPETGRLYLQQRIKANSMHLHTDWKAYNFGKHWDVKELPVYYKKGKNNWVFSMSRLKSS